MNNNILDNYVVFSDEVLEAIKTNKPIVALESTIISHGMPYPKNALTAYEAENTVRNNGAVPATIAIIKGKLKVGLSHEEIDYLASKGREVIKVSRRDIAYVVSNGLDGATTVASTMYIASLANIKVFATGGIGGVHRDANNTFDISCDLEELARTDVAVICAGPKAILDLSKTLEYLETKGVDVIGYKTDLLPAFYSSTSEYKVTHRFDTPEGIAKMLNTKWDLGLNGGVLITNPIPKEYEVEESVINEAIDKALKEMDSLHITGKDVTPFLLAKIVEITKGDSLEANIKLVMNNCALAANIASSMKE